MNNTSPKIDTPFTFPCGQTIQNRIIKSAMSENMGENFSAGERILKLYKTWASGESGILITGNIMVDKNALGEHRNVVVEGEKSIVSLKKWVGTMAGTGTKLWAQINHPGRQAMKKVNKSIVAPSAVGVRTPLLKLFPIPRALKENEIFDIIAKFANTALILKKAGFHGVQIHGAHGYLVSQFLSPLTNQREDQWGGDLENRARFLVEVYKAIREKVGKDFPVGVKINSADFQRGGFSEEDSMKVVKMLGNLNIDMIEISGGTYEKAAMMGATEKESTKKREAYFVDYVEKARNITDKPLLLTGGFRSKTVMNEALADGKVDLIGIARPFSIYPQLPKELISGKREDVFFPKPTTGLKKLDKMGFLELLWCQMQIKKLGKGEEPNTKIGMWPVVKKLLNI